MNTESLPSPVPILAPSVPSGLQLSHPGARFGATHHYGARFSYQTGQGHPVIPLLASISFREGLAWWLLCYPDRKISSFLPSS